MASSEETVEIDGEALPVEAPATPAEVGDLVRRCAAEGRAVYPVAGRTMLDYGTPPARPGVAVDLRNLNQVIDYPARDLTVTVQAGVTAQRLHALLAGENQELPIDVAQPDRATLGGSVACDFSGSRRLGHGTLRDYVIGITIVNDRGEECSAGGRVVKNVAGYDMGKLYTGSLGTLGVITQVTFKLRPRPEARQLLIGTCSAGNLAASLEDLSRSATRPAIADLLNPAATRELNRQAGRCIVPETNWVLVLGFEGSAAAVAWQGEQVRSDLPDVTFSREAEGADLDDLLAALTESPAVAGCEFAVGAYLLSSGLACVTLEMPSDLRLHAHAGNGILRGGFASTDMETARRVMDDMLKRILPLQGNAIVRRCPVEWKAQLPVWGRSPAALEMMKEVKGQLDPANLFNPGRFII